MIKGSDIHLVPQKPPVALLSTISYVALVPCSKKVGKVSGACSCQGF